MNSKDIFSQNIIKVIEDNVSKDETLIISVSGGVDSIVLLRIISEWGGRNIVAVHVNHNLRGEDSVNDSYFVQNLCSEYGLRYYNYSFDANEYAASVKKGVEEASRDARKNCLKQVQERYPNSWIVLGHHGNDRVETLLFNLCRGASVHGAASMRAADGERRLIRPLLGFKKQDIREYAENHNWEWVEDSSNAVNVYDRNWLRNDILPNIEERKPGATERLMAAAERFEGISEYLQMEAQKWVENNNYAMNKTMKKPKEIGDNFHAFRIVDFNKEHDTLKGEVLYHLYKVCNGSNQGFNSKMLDRAINWLARNPYSGNLYFGKYNNIYAVGNYFFVPIL